MKAEELTTAIMSGTWTEHELKAINQAVDYKRMVLAGDKRNQLRVGQTIWFNETTRPNYLIGEEATITKINRERIIVALKNGTTGRFFGSGIRTALSLITTEKPPYAKPVRQAPPEREKMTITKSDVGSLKDFIK